MSKYRDMQNNPDNYLNGRTNHKLLELMYPNFRNFFERSALSFASYAHSIKDQRRKYSGIPYIHHPREVAEMLIALDFDDESVAAACLHDVVEDTCFGLDKIESDFGPNVRYRVEMVTDISRPEDGNRKIRKEIDRKHIAQGDYFSKSIKLADLISNSRDIIKNDRAFAIKYMEEKNALLEVLSDGHPVLFKTAQDILYDYYRTRNRKK